MTEKPQPAPQYIKAESVEPADAAGTQTSEQSSTTNTSQYSYSYLFLLDEDSPLARMSGAVIIDSWLDVSLLVRGDPRTKREAVNALKGKDRDPDVEIVAQKAVQMYLRAKGQNNLIGPMMIRTLTPVKPYEVTDYLMEQSLADRRHFYQGAAVPIGLLGLQL